MIHLRPTSWLTLRTTLLLIDDGGRQIGLLQRQQDGDPWLLHIPPLESRLASASVRDTMSRLHLPFEQVTQAVQRYESFLTLAEKLAYEPLAEDEHALLNRLLTAVALPRQPVAAHAAFAGLERLGLARANSLVDGEGNPVATWEATALARAYGHRPVADRFIEYLPSFDSTGRVYAGIPFEVDGEMFRIEGQRHDDGAIGVSRWNRLDGADERWDVTLWVNCRDDYPTVSFSYRFRDPSQSDAPATREDDPLPQPSRGWQHDIRNGCGRWVLRYQQRSEATANSVTTTSPEDESPTP